MMQAMGAMQCCMDRDKTEEGIIQKPQAIGDRRNWSVFNLIQDG